MNARGGLNGYFVAQALHFASGGMMAVVFAWLITHELHESQARVGLAQFLANLPMMILVFFGGAAADGRNLLRYTANLQLAIATIPIALAIVIALGQLSFVSATLCILVSSVIVSFLMPARDALLSHMTPPELGLARASAMAIASTFGGQLVGTAIAASASTVGAVPLLSLQAILLALSAILTGRLRPVNPHAFANHEPSRLSRILHDIRDGFAVVWRHDRLRTVIAYLILVGPLFNGMFLVGLPLMVRDVYKGDSALLATLVGTFLAGLTLSSFAMSRMRPIEGQGRALMLLALNNIVVFTLAHFALPFAVFALLMFSWGLGGGASMALSRGMVQAAAPPAYRARVLSVLQFSQVAGGPPGALVYGFMSQAFGILNTLLIIPVGVIVLWTTFRLTTNLWHFTREEALAEATAPVALD